jgi:hypothetical protein
MVKSHIMPLKRSPFHRAIYWRSMPSASCLDAFDFPSSALVLPTLQRPPHSSLDRALAASYVTYLTLSPYTPREQLGRYRTRPNLLIPDDLLRLSFDLPPPLSALLPRRLGRTFTAPTSSSRPCCASFAPISSHLSSNPPSSSLQSRFRSSSLAVLYLLLLDSLCSRQPLSRQAIHRQACNRQLHPSWLHIPRLPQRRKRPCLDGHVAKLQRQLPDYLHSVLLGQGVHLFWHSSRESVLVWKLL